MMKRFALLISVLAAAGALLRAAGASARIVELGSQADDAPLNCPGTTESPCVAAVRMTGYQGRSSGGPKNPFYIRRDGVPDRLHGPAGEADRGGDQVLPRTTSARRPRPGSRCCAAATTRKTRLDHRLITQSDTFELDRYFGSRPTFVFDKPIPVKKGNWIAITVPTWAPLLSTNLARTNWWRSSRCEGQLRAAQEPAAVRDGGSARGERSSAAPTTAPACSTRSPTCRATTSRTRRVKASKKGFNPP